MQEPSPRWNVRIVRAALRIVCDWLAALGPSFGIVPVQAWSDGASAPGGLPVGAPLSQTEAREWENIVAGLRRMP
jgi:hypothetical protein